jgi:hypothetical protein
MPRPAEVVGFERGGEPVQRNNGIVFFDEKQDWYVEGTGIKRISVCWKSYPLHWFFRHTAGCRDRETLDFRKGETDCHWLQRFAAIDRATQR